MKFWKQFSVFLLFVFSALYITHPLIFHLGDYVTSFGDELFIAWNHNWIIHSFFTNPLNIFNANIYFPYKNTLAFSEPFITSGVLSIIPVWLVKQPIAAVNFILISSIVLTGFAVYLLCLKITKNHLASFASAFLLIFSPAFLDKKTHLQVMALEYIPLSILFTLIYLKKEKFIYLIFSALFFLFQIYNSFMPGYFLVFFYSIFLSVLFFSKKVEFAKLINKKSLILVLTTIILTIPLITPYFKVSKEFNGKRDIRDAIHFALQPEDFFVANEHSRFNKLLTIVQNPTSYPKNAEIKPGFIGGIFSFLFIASLIKFPYYLKKKNIFYITFFIVSILGLILSLGPALHFNRQTIHFPFLIPLPYGLFYYLLPGFQGFRNSARFEMLFILMSTIPIAVFLSDWFKYLKNKKYLFFGLLMLGIILEFPGPIKFFPIAQTKDFPFEHKFLATTPVDSVYLEMPIYNWNMFPYSGEELRREYFSTIHFRKSVNGYSGFSPYPWQDMTYRLAQTFPDEKSIREIKKIGVSYLVIHKNEYDAISKKGFELFKYKFPNGQTVRKKLLENKALELVKTNENVDIFKFSN